MTTFLRAEIDIFCVHTTVTLFVCVTGFTWFGRRPRPKGRPRSSGNTRTSTVCVCVCACVCEIFVLLCVIVKSKLRESPCEISKCIGQMCFFRGEATTQCKDFRRRALDLQKSSTKNQAQVGIIDICLESQRSQPNLCYPVPTLAMAGL